MTTRRLLAVASASAVVAVGSTLLVAVPANAVPTACGSNKACMYRHNLYGGGYFNFKESISDLNGHIFSPVGYWSANDAVSSVYNSHPSKCVKFFQHRNYGGIEVKLGAKQEDSDLNDASGGISRRFNDTISSAKFVPCR
jgi:hypothetical protein